MHNIRFIESTHQYLNDKDEDLVSVSKFTEKFKQKQDWKAIATRSAAKKTKEGTPTTAQELMAKWKKKGDISREVGTLLHYIKEKEILDRDKPVFYDIECDKMVGTYSEGFKNSIPINELKNNCVYPELMIYDLEHMICGQSDKVIVTDNKIHVWDYKTDLEMSFVGYSNQWMTARKLLAPLDHLDECNGNIYSIKMSLYMYMLWRANKGKLKVGDIIIEHVHLKRDPDNDNIPVLENGSPVILKTEQITLPYRKKEVMAMLKTLRNDS